MIGKYIIVREDKEDSQVYVNGESDSLDEANQWIYDDKNFNANDFKYEIYEKVEV